MREEFVCAEEYKPLIPDRIYEAQCISYNDNFVLGKARKVFLHFEITEYGEHFEKRIFMAFNMPYDKKIKQGSKYYKTWVMVNGWRKPSRNSIMSPKLFKNKVYKIKTRTVRPKQVSGKDMPENFFYSVVDYITEVIAGYVNPKTTPEP